MAKAYRDTPPTGGPDGAVAAKDIGPLNGQDITGDAGLDKPVEPAFDPSRHTVPEVNAYLESDITVIEFDRVVAAEIAGQNRKGIVG